MLESTVLISVFVTNRPRNASFVDLFRSPRCFSLGEYFEGNAFSAPIRLEKTVSFSVREGKPSFFLTLASCTSVVLSSFRSSNTFSALCPSFKSSLALLLYCVCELGGWVPLLRLATSTSPTSLLSSDGTVSIVVLRGRL